MQPIGRRIWEQKEGKNSFLTALTRPRRRTHEVAMDEVKYG